MMDEGIYFQKSLQQQKEGNMVIVGGDQLPSELVWNKEQDVY
jgi:hypothetical protein